MKIFFSNEEEGSIRHPDRGSIFIRHFINAMDASAHRMKFAEVASVMRELAENFRSDCLDNQEVIICYESQNTAKRICFF